MKIGDVYTYNEWQLLNKLFAAAIELQVIKLCQQIMDPYIVQIIFQDFWFCRKIYHFDQLLKCDRVHSLWDSIIIKKKISVINIIRSIFITTVTNRYTRINHMSFRISNRNNCALWPLLNSINNELSPNNRHCS